MLGALSMLADPDWNVALSVNIGSFWSVDIDSSAVFDAGVEKDGRVVDATVADIAEALTESDIVDGIVVL